MASHHLKKFDRNDQGRDFVVGDLHGSITKFNSLLEVIGFDKTKDRMFSVGDLADRGENSVACCMLLKEDWFFAVRGNHEQMLVNSVNTDLSDRIRDMWSGNFIMNGGKWWVELFSEDESKAIEIAAMFDSLPVFIEVDVGNERKVGIVHAEIQTFNWKEAIDEFNEMDFIDPDNSELWGRKIIRFVKENPGEIDNIGVEGIHAVVVGHTPVAQSFSIGNIIYADTKAYAPEGVLTCVEINGPEFKVYVSKPTE